MTQTGLIIDSLSLMAIGMGTVFSFLLALVVLLRVMSWLVERLAPGRAEPMHSAVPARPLGEVADTELIAVISAAVARYRSSR